MELVAFNIFARGTSWMHKSYHTGDKQWLKMKEISSFIYNMRQYIEKICHQEYTVFSFFKQA